MWQTNRHCPDDDDDDGEVCDGVADVDVDVDRYHVEIANRPLNDGIQNDDDGWAFDGGGQGEDRSHASVDCVWRGW